MWFAVETFSDYMTDLEIVFWLIPIKPKETMETELFANTEHVYIFLAVTKHYVHIKLISTTSNHWEFTMRVSLHRNQIHITRHLLWNTLEIYWSSVLLKLGISEVTLPTLVTMPVMITLALYDDKSLDYVSMCTFIDSADKWVFITSVCI